MKILLTLVLLLNVFDAAVADKSTGENDCNLPAFTKKTLKGKIHTYCIDGKKLPLFNVHGYIASNQKVQLYLNDHKLTEFEPKRSLSFDFTVNQHLIIGKKNVLKIRYKILKSWQKTGFNNPIFKVDVTKQKDWNNPKSAVLLKSFSGPNGKVVTANQEGISRIVFIPNINE